MKHARSVRVPAAIALAAVVVAIFPSCSRTARISSLKFPSTPVISTEDSVVLVLEPYISIRDRPGESGVTVAHGRRGEIFGVIGKSIVENGKEKAVWIHLENGWVEEKSVRLYSGKDKAQRAAESLDNN